MAKVEWEDATVLAAIKRGAASGVMMAGEIVHGEAVRLITQGKKTGRVYRRRGVLHQASAPGESPASDTGRLAQSGRTIPGPETSAFVSFGTVYARALELGSSYQITSSGGNAGGIARQFEFGTQTLAPRPFLRPALANKKQEIIATIASEVEAALGGGKMLESLNGVEA